MNRIIISGNVGADPEIGCTGNGTATARFRVAVYNFRNKEKPDWFTVDVYGYNVDFVSEHVTKGTQVIVSGEIHNFEYEKDGEKHYGTSITSDRVETTRKIDAE